jgi:hypothetical protein
MKTNQVFVNLTLEEVSLILMLLNNCLSERLTRLSEEKIELAETLWESLLEAKEEVGLSLNFED